MPIKIRIETPADVAAIDAVTVAAFLDTPHAAHTEQFIVKALRGAGKLAVSLVAEDAGAVIGHVALSPVVISDGSQGWYGLGPISVLPDRQRQEIGSRLMLAALDALREIGAVGCALVGDPHFYARFGFRLESALILPEVPPEYFQAILLRGPMPAGTVAFDPAFSAPA